jgi:hypothetical protein
MFERHNVVVHELLQNAQIAANIKHREHVASMPQPADGLMAFVDGVRHE